VWVSERLGGQEWAATSDGLPNDLRNLPPKVEMPKIVHTIWLGSPVTADRAATRAIQANVANWRNVLGDDWQIVVWTNVPRIDFERARRPGADSDDIWLRGIRDMLRWAHTNHLLLIAVDEVFHDKFPLGDLALDEYFRMEVAKRHGRGYAAASDILRLVILQEFGGVYSDGDNTLTTTDGLFELFNQKGFAVRGRPSSKIPEAFTFLNSAILAGVGHPFIRLYLRHISDNYDEPQPSLMTNEVPDSLFSSLETLRGGQPHMRHSVVFRTGPNVLTGVAKDSGYFRIAHPWIAQVFPQLVQVEDGAGNSWMPNNETQATAAGASGGVLGVLQGLIAALVRDVVFNRPNELCLTAIEPTVSGLPDPPAAWRAILLYLHSNSRLKPLVEWVIDRRLILDPTGEPQVEYVDLPADMVELLFGSTRGTDSSVNLLERGWIRAERRTPTDIRTWRYRFPTSFEMKFVQPPAS
jgi:hypothetical protein